MGFKINKLILLVVCALSAGACAHKTFHERCTENEEWKRYGSYNSCITEKKEEMAKKMQLLNDLNASGSEAGRGISGIDSYEKQRSDKNQRKCVSRKNFLGEIETICENSRD